MLPTQNYQFSHRLVLYAVFAFIAFVLSDCLLAPALAAQTSAELPTEASLEARLEQVKNNTNLTESEKLQTIGKLQFILKQREAAIEQKRQAVNYTEMYTKAPDQKKIYEAKATALKVRPLPNSVKRATLTNLESLVTKNDAELAVLRKQLVQITTDIKNEKAFDIQLAIDEARQAIRIQSVENSSSDTDEIDRLKQQITIYFQQSKIENLEQRLLSRNARLSLWDAQQKLLDKQINLLDSKQSQIRALVTNHRQNDVNKIMTKAKSSLNTYSKQPELIRKLAQKNIDLAEELKKLVNDQDNVIEEKDQASLNAQKLQQKFTSLTEQLAITQLGSSPEYGAALRKQRDQIADESRARRALQAHKSALTQSRLSQFRIDGLLEIDPEVESSSLWQLLGSESEQQITGEQKQIVRELLASRNLILEKLSTAYWNYISNLTSLTAQSSSIITLNRQYAELLDQQLLWMPSSPAMNTDSIGAIDDSFSWLTNTKIWRGIYSATSVKVQKWSLLIGVFGSLIILLIIRRQKMITTLSNMKDRVGKVNRDKMEFTLMAIVINFSLALPGPLILFSLSLLVSHATIFSTALSDALHYGAILYFILNFVLQGAREDGLLSLHLKWSLYIVHALRKNLPWFMLIFVPSIVIVSLIEDSATPEIRDSLGRVIFILQTITMAVFIRYVLPPARSALWIERTKNSPESSELLYQNARFVMTIIIPLILVILSAYGYHYSSVQLETHLLNSALVVLASNLSFCFTQRLFAINERQLALEKLRAKRAAAIAAKKLENEDSEETDDEAQTAIDLQEIDLQTISKQTRSLIKLVFTVVAAIALWRVWSEIFPAFKPLVDVELWQVQEFNDNVAENISVTLWDLLLSITSLVITYLAARNISGLLDVALLRRVSLKPGSSYTIATVAQYAIVIVGSVIALQGLGAQWAKLQWLVAALSVGLGFGLQELVANFVSGIIILFERPFRIGDTVTVGDQWGTVTKIRMRATTIIDWDRRETIVPNKTFIQEKLTNWTLTDTITRRKIDVGVAYGSDTDLVEMLLMKIAHENPKVQDEPPPEAFFVNFGDNSLNFCLRIFVKGHREHAAVVHEIHKAIDHEFRAHGIEIAFPQRDLHLDDKPISINLVEPKQQQDPKPPKS